MATEDSAVSRPSKTNCTTDRSKAETADERLSLVAQWWKQKNRIVDSFVAEMPARAARPVSVQENTKLRDEAVMEKYDSGFRSRSWSLVMNEFLNWYNGYRHAHLKFVNPEGETVRTQMPNSHQPRYGSKYYARLKALERQMVEEFDNPFTAMLTFSASSRNENGGWRCPADHLRDVVSTWRPDRGRGVYHAVRDALGGKDWCYSAVIEKHKSCYGHVHVAVFVDGEISESDFHAAMDRHVKLCDSAHRDAHNYFHEKKEKRPISVKKVSPKKNANADEVDSDAVNNLGSYLGEYIGAYGDELFNRPTEEIAFRAVAWATGSQMVRFSTRANELIRADCGDDGDNMLDRVPHFDVRPDDDGDGGSVMVDANGKWDLKSVCRIDRDGEEDFAVKHQGVIFEEIDGAESLDPPKQCSPKPPQPPAGQVELSRY
ncbi:replication protein [Haladaptatus sp. CMAA 1911]|uniref:replication protein n=1 Tax=unclassified Haladaptatus TaxID=2622732 RepID=UPI0037550010